MFKRQNIYVALRNNAFKQPFFTLSLSIQYQSFANCNPKFKRRMNCLCFLDIFVGVEVFVIEPS